MTRFSKSLYYGALLVAPFILSSAVHTASANSQQSQPVMRVGANHYRSVQYRANHTPTALRNYRKPIARYDNSYWFNRINRVAYNRKQYYHPTINWNARDLGGYYAGHGYYTRPDKVFRGGDIHHISRNGINTMRRFHIDHVIDLRSHHYQGGKDKRISGIKYTQYPVNSLKQKKALKPLKNRYGGEIYKYGTSFVSSSQARWAYHKVFDQLLQHNQDGATYVHCIDGRDRTGIMSVLYLSSLGVSKWNIFNDFLLTNYYRYKYPYRTRTGQVAELNRFYHVVNHRYHGMHHYLTHEIGLSNGQLREMKKLYLIKK